MCTQRFLCFCIEYENSYFNFAYNIYDKKWMCFDFFDIIYENRLK